MTTERDATQEQRLQFVDSLLKSLHDNNREHAQSLVTVGLERIATAAPETEVKSRHFTVPAYPPPLQLIGLLAAAVVLTAIFVPYFVSSRSAMAAVTQSIEEAWKDVGRHYSAKSRIQVGELGTVERTGDLYLKGGERFAIHMDGVLPESGIWLIGDRGRAWVVPPIGPILEGDVTELIDWLARRDDLATPYLHLSTILDRMRDSYHLKSMPDLMLQTKLGAVTCQHIVGTLKEPGDGGIPDRIELWVEAESGIAMKVIAQWQTGPGTLGRESIELEFLTEVDLSDAFFTPASHGGLTRPRVSFSSTSR